MVCLFKLSKYTPTCSRHALRPEQCEWNYVDNILNATSWQKSMCFISISQNCSQVNISQHWLSTYSQLILLLPPQTSKCYLNMQTGLFGWLMPHQINNCKNDWKQNPCDIEWSNTHSLNCSNKYSDQSINLNAHPKQIFVWHCFVRKRNWNETMVCLNDLPAQVVNQTAY